MNTQEEFDLAVCAYKRMLTPEEITAQVRDVGLPEWVIQGAEHVCVHNYGVHGRPWSEQTSVWNVQWIKLDVQMDPRWDGEQRLARMGGNAEDYTEIVGGLVIQRGLLIVELWGLARGQGKGKTEA